MDILVIKNIIYELIGKKGAPLENPYRYYHGTRVANLSLILRKYISPDDETNDDIITVAAWFHDIMNIDGKRRVHAEEGALKAEEVLREFCSADELNKICYIIRFHDNRSLNNDYPYYLKLHQDADTLDHLGTLDIWSTFLHTVAQGKLMGDSINVFKNIYTDVNNVKDSLNYEISKKIFSDKMAFLKDFTDRFTVESRGEIWNFENLF